MSKWDDLDPFERARRLAIVEAEDPRPDEREIFARTLDRLDVPYSLEDPRYWPMAAFLLAMIAYPEEFGEERGRGAEQVWDERRLLRLAATAMVVRAQHPDWGNLRICRYLVDPANGYRRLWPVGTRPPKAGTLDNWLRKAEQLAGAVAVMSGKADRNYFIALHAVEPRPTIKRD